MGPDSQMCLNISIGDDQLVEETERLVVCGFSTVSAVLVQNMGCTDVFVEDNDGNSIVIQYLIIYSGLNSYSVAQFQFSQSSYNVSEDSGVVSVCLELVNGTLIENVTIEIKLGATEILNACK